MRQFLILLIFLSPAALHASEINTFKDVFFKIPETTLGVLGKSVQKESLPYWGAIIGSTVLLYQYDESILLDTQRVGRKIGIGNDDSTSAVITFQGSDVLRLPSDWGGAMYFLGDGWLHFGIAGGLLLYGKVAGESRPVRTSYQLIHGMATSTITSQLLKRTTGRESPFVRTEPGGDWYAFPSYSRYAGNTPKYDAFPSGHVMTATMTLTVLSNNYPEYRWIIRPVGIGLVSLLAWEMVNNGVHWASDYPLAIALGYMYGNEVSDHPGKYKKEKNYSFVPIVSDGHYGLTFAYSFQ